jgi:hypothetical protein
MHRYLDAYAENVSEKTLRLTRGNLRGSKANHLDRGLQVTIGKPKLLITFEEGGSADAACVADESPSCS